MSIQCVPAVVLGRSVPRAAAAQTMEPVILSMAPVSVIQDGLAVTALNVGLLWTLETIIYCNLYMLDNVTALYYSSL